MARTTALAVQKVLDAGGDYRPNKDLSPYIDVGSAIVDDLVTYATDNDITVPGAARLELIERWLAAWSYCMSDQPYSSRSTDGASASFQGQTAMYLEANKYGQTAVSLDPTGYLVTLAKGEGPTSASAVWLGTRYSDQPDYDDR